MRPHFPSPAGVSGLLRPPPAGPAPAPGTRGRPAPPARPRPAGGRRAAGGPGAPPGGRRGPRRPGAAARAAAWRAGRGGRGPRREASGPESSRGAVGPGRGRPAGAGRPPVARRAPLGRRGPHAWRCSSSCLKMMSKGPNLSWVAGREGVRTRCPGPGAWVGIGGKSGGSWCQSNSRGAPCRRVFRPPRRPVRARQLSKCRKWREGRPRVCCSPTARKLGCSWAVRPPLSQAP